MSSGKYLTALDQLFVGCVQRYIDWRIKPGGVLTNK